MTDSSATPGTASPTDSTAGEWEYNSWTFYRGHWFDNAALYAKGWEVFQVDDRHVGEHRIYARRISVNAPAVTPAEEGSPVGRG